MDNAGLVRNQGLYVLIGSRKAESREETPLSSKSGGEMAAVPAVEEGAPAHNAKFAWKQLLPNVRQNAFARQAQMTVATFVEKKFLPEYVALKRTAGRTHYRAMLKHILKPEVVDSIFQAKTKNGRIKLKSIPDWPYLDNLRISEARTADVQQLISAALQSGYSIQTVTHIRNVVGSIFSHAKREQFFIGENPAAAVKLPQMTRKKAYSVGMAEAAQLLSAMKTPERELSLIAMLTGMNVAEICGLRWKHVNLTDMALDTDGELIAPRTLAVRTQWHRGELNSVKQGRRRSLTVPEPLYSVLLRVQHRPSFTSPEDFVLVSRVGTPICQTNLVARRLKPIGRRLEMPWLSWNVLQRARTKLVAEFGDRFHENMATLLRDIAAQEIA